MTLGHLLRCVSIPLLSVELRHSVQGTIQGTVKLRKLTKCGTPSHRLGVTTSSNFKGVFQRQYSFIIELNQQKKAHNGKSVIEFLWILWCSYIVEHIHLFTILSLDSSSYIVFLFLLPLTKLV